MTPSHRFAFIHHINQGFAIFRIRPEDQSLHQIAHSDNEFWAMTLTNALNDYFSGSGINQEIPEDAVNEA